MKVTIKESFSFLKPFKKIITWEGNCAPIKDGNSPGIHLYSGYDLIKSIQETAYEDQVTALINLSGRITAITPPPKMGTVLTAAWCPGD